MFKFTTSRAVAALLSAAVLGSVAIAPAAAREAKTQQYKLKKAVVDGQVVYCYEQRITGTLVPSRTCHTKEEWAQQGSVLDPAEREANANTNANKDGASKS